MESEFPVSKVKYSCVMVKLSGESLMGEQCFGLHPPAVESIADELLPVYRLGVRICLVIGGGNLFRGIQGVAHGMERTTADYMGMLGTVINALAVQSSLEARGVATRVLSAIPMPDVCEPFILRRARRHLEKHRICIFAAGTGSPYFTTDTAAILRASEMNCEVMFKATKVDGVYDKDPTIEPSARRYESVTYNEALQKHLKVIDASALAIARDNKLPIIVCSMAIRGGLQDILEGRGTYTIIR